MYEYEYECEYEYEDEDDYECEYEYENEYEYGCEYYPCCPYLYSAKAAATTSVWKPIGTPKHLNGPTMSTFFHPGLGVFIMYP